ncbi:hypothetical protein R1flu_014274 [Riccia fluitans]|uniref:Uncharacterized protein n=1 Tax=Riccia fluitans TaxID=41844 RepID=A0ABD1YFZ0_9MARC
MSSHSRNFGMPNPERVIAMGCASVNHHLLRVCAMSSDATFTSHLDQLPTGASIPKRACARSYAVKDSQEFPYDASILLENILDPTHIHISHDRVDLFSKREKAKAMDFIVTERSENGLAGEWHFLDSPEDKNGNTVLEQDMGFLAAQNEMLYKEQRPTREVYLNMRSQDRSGAHPAGLGTSMISNTPAKEAFVHRYARDPNNRYNRHVVHCKSWRDAVKRFETLQVLTLALAVVSTAMAIVSSKPVWRIAFVVSALLMCIASWGCKRVPSLLTENYVRPQKLTP